MKPVMLSPGLASALKQPHCRDAVSTVVDHLARNGAYACAERLTGRRVLRVYAGGHRILYRETRSQITLLSVRRTVRRRWDRVLS